MKISGEKLKNVQTKWMVIYFKAIQVGFFAFISFKTYQNYLLPLFRKVSYHTDAS